MMFKNKKTKVANKKRFASNEKIIIWTEIAWDQYLSWMHDSPELQRKINDLINDIRRSPFMGIGKPEPLKMELQGKWSRRINSQHRLVYEIKENQLIIFACRYHY